MIDFESKDKDREALKNKKVKGDNEDFSMETHKPQSRFIYQKKQKESAKIEDPREDATDEIFSGTQGGMP